MDSLWFRVGPRWVLLQRMMLVSAAVIAVCAAANAQVTSPPASPTVPPDIAPGHTAGGKPIVTPNSASQGVIPPPLVGDSGINKGAPSGGTMPVIRPPGTPGGNQQVQPK